MLPGVSGGSITPSVSGTEDNRPIRTPPSLTFAPAGRWMRVNLSPPPTAATAETPTIEACLRRSRKRAGAEDRWKKR